MGEAEANGADGAAAVGRFEHDQSATGADQGGSGVQQFVQGVVERAGSGQSLGEFVERGEIGDPGGQPVLDEASGGGRHSGQRIDSVR